MSWFQRNPKKTIIIANISVLLLVVILLEILLRSYLTYNPGFYTYSSDSSAKELRYPYGNIKINQFGHPDEEFDLNSNLKRIGYVGDSVCYGVGVGYGYRISDIIKIAYPNYTHMTFAGAGNGMDEDGIRYTKALVKKFKLNAVIYLMNLNDLLPDKDELPTTKLHNVTNSDFFKLIDKLRGKSYLYTYIRNNIKTYLIVKDYNYNGYFSYELYPYKFENIIAQAGKRINRIHRELKNYGVKLIVVLLPYEMQISKEAESKYKTLNIKWQDEFIDRGPQKLLIKYFDKDLTYYDAFYAFVSKNDIKSSREENKIGEYFVYTLGDKLDWNHPNRKGDWAIAQFLIKNNILSR